MYLPGFQYYKPTTLDEAILLLKNSSNGVPVAGGTDLLVEMKKGIRKHSELISLGEIAELKLISEEEKNIVIGAGVSHSELIESEIISKFLPALSLAATQIGSEQIRNRGTIGGNLCTAASCSDTAPVLITMEAKVEVSGTSGARILNLDDFFVFNKKTILRKDEILTRILVPKPKPNTGIHFEKFGLRKAVSISVVSVAVKIVLKNEFIDDALVVIGAVAPTPKISINASSELIGKNLTGFYENSEVLEVVGKGAAEDSIPIDDIRAGAAYRRQVLNVLTKRAVLKAISNAKN